MSDAEPIQLWRARRIVTMNRDRPDATHVARRGDRILGVGECDELAGWGEHAVDDTFAGKILMPDFVEGHSRSTEDGQPTGELQETAATFMAYRQTENPLIRSLVCCAHQGPLRGKVIG